jgi:hypothetical protein
MMSDLLLQHNFLIFENMGAEKKEIIFGGEPIYEVVKDR